MNKILLLLTIFGLFSSVTIAQQKAQKPKVMVVPEEAFCINAGMYKKNALGEKVADYKVAMRNDNVLDVINTFENLMAGYGFNLTNLQQTLDELKEEAALENVLTAKDDGIIVEDDLEKMSRVAGTDIVVKVSPKISHYGPDLRLELRVSSIDCASKKALQAFGPVTKTTAGSVSMLIKAAVTDNIETFALGLAKYYEDLQAKGREGTIIIKVTDTCPLNLESMVNYNGEEGELSDLIELWLSENAVNGAYTGSKTSRVGMKLDQVRIPLMGESCLWKNQSTVNGRFCKNRIGSAIK